MPLALVLLRLAVEAVHPRLQALDDAGREAASALFGVVIRLVVLAAAVIVIVWLFRDVAPSASLQGNAAIVLGIFLVAKTVAEVMLVARPPKGREVR
ncbi:hypothetical protein [Aestuariimicrobium ganziense]|uniref:hypothetical protein n=1 Tax=Aestuariimicrobium ganziense TaxID=2773677 RepID=UPI0019409EA5|nr:hypothetical protein [Aestuariimicrobium ganziense]